MDTDEGERPNPGRIPSTLATAEPIQDVDGSAAPWLAFAAIFGLLAGSVALTIFAGPITDYLQVMAEQLTTPALYSETVLRMQEGSR